MTKKKSLVPIEAPALSIPATVSQPRDIRATARAAQSPKMVATPTPDKDIPVSVATTGITRTAMPTVSPSAQPVAPPPTDEELDAMVVTAPAVIASHTAQVAGRAQYKQFINEHLVGVFIDTHVDASISFAAHCGGVALVKCTADTPPSRARSMGADSRIILPNRAIVIIDDSTTLRPAELDQVWRNAGPAQAAHLLWLCNRPLFDSMAGAYARALRYPVRARTTMGVYAAPALAWELRTTVVVPAEHAGIMAEHAGLVPVVHWSRLYESPWLVYPLLRSAGVWAVKQGNSPPVVAVRPPHTASTATLATLTSALQQGDLNRKILPDHLSG